MHYIDKGLSVVPVQTLDLLSFTAVREDAYDQGDTLVRSGGTINQAFPCWSATACEEVRQART